MKIIGLTGNIGSGKSSASKIFEKFNSYVINADMIGHEVLISPSPAYKELTGIFGEEILAENREIDRKKLGAIVFSDSVKLAALTEITHKYITKKINEIIAELRNSDYSFIIIDAPLLIEAGVHKVCDYVVVIFTDDESRAERIAERDGRNASDMIRRNESQSSFEFKKRYADFIVDNSGNIEELCEKIEDIVTKLKKI